MFTLLLLNFDLKGGLSSHGNRIYYFTYMIKVTPKMCLKISTLYYSAALPYVEIRHH